MYLRRYPSKWRTRRTDSFTPVELQRAAQKILIDGVISDDLVMGFLGEYASTDREPGDAVGQDELEALLAEQGRFVSIVVPALELPKRLLLEFDASTSGRPLSPISRSEEARIEAAYLADVLLAANGTGRVPALPRLQSLHFALAFLVYQNPHETGQRVQEWERNRRFMLRSRPGRQDPSEWMRFELEQVSELNDKLAKGVVRVIASWASNLTAAERATFSFQERERRGSLDAYEGIHSLVQYGFRDLVRLAKDWDDARVLPDAFLDNGRLSIEALVGNVVDGMTLLAELLPADGVSRRELLRTLDYAHMYFAFGVDLSAPFQIHVSHQLPLRTPKPRFGLALYRLPVERLRLIWRTGHFYPLDIRAAPSLHLEVGLESPELQILLGKRHRPPRRIGVVLWKPGTPNFSASAKRDGDFIEANARPSQSLVHFYSSKRLDEAKKLDDIRGELFIFVPIRFTSHARIGYILLLAAIATATIFIWKETLSVLHVRPAGDPKHLREMVTAGALVVPLSLWLLGTHPTSPLVSQKLWGFRAAAYAMCFAILAAFCALLVCLGGYGGDALNAWSRIVDAGSSLIRR